MNRSRALLLCDAILFAVTAVTSVVVSGLRFAATVIGIVIGRIIRAISAGAGDCWTAAAARACVLYAEDVLEREAAALAV